MIKEPEEAKLVPERLCSGYKLLGSEGQQVYPGSKTEDFSSLGPPEVKKG